MNSRVVFVDIETTGLDNQKHDIIQIAAIATEWPTLEELGRFEMKASFDRDSADSFALTNGVYAECQDNWDDISVAPEVMHRRFARFLEKFRSVPKISKKTGRTWYATRLAGYNIHKFDSPFLWESFRKFPDVFFPAHGATLDVYALASWELAMQGYTGSGKLADVCEYFGIPVDGDMHDAMVDIEATLNLARALKGRLWD